MSDDPPDPTPPQPPAAPPAYPFVPPPPSPTVPGPRSRRGKLAVIGLLVVVAAAVAIIVAVRAATPKGPPSVPGNVSAEGTICTPPDCPVLSGTVTISWSAPQSGSPVTGYEVLRGGVKITSQTLAATTTSYRDNDTALGTSLTYVVLAHSDAGDSGHSAEATAKLPLPPERFAQLSGIFRVRLTVQRASNLGKAEGINQPAPGDTSMQTWALEPSCPTNTGPCAVKLLTFDGIVLRARGRAYEASGHGLPATCFAAGKTPSTHSFHIVPAEPRMKGPNWVYTSFTGTSGLSFSCPGSPTSSATFTLTARNTKPEPSATSPA